MQKNKILIPTDAQIMKTIKEAKLESPQIDFRIYEHGLIIRITIVIVDKKECMIVESKDDTKDSSYNAAGLSTYVYDAKDDIIFIEADKPRITQVLYNLLRNAVKFTEEGTILVNVQKPPQEDLIVSVKDTGTGIDLGIFPRLFEKFASKSFQGLGLGLFISKSIVEAHGGRIWAENNPNAQRGYILLHFTTS